jgi:protein-tyrosine phosphatase
MAASRPKPVRVCFVCLGNICRSPTAEGVMLALLAERGLSEQVSIDSAGTGAYHVGEPADARSREAASRRGVVLASRARLFVAEDFDTFDYIVAMDSRNLAHLQRMAGSRSEHRAKLSLLRSFHAASGELDVPDPYYRDNFDEVFDICRDGCVGLLELLVKRHGLAP